MELGSAAWPSYTWSMKPAGFPNEGTDLADQVRELGQMMSQLEALESRATKASSIIPGETVFRDPKDAYHQITVGAVLIRYELSAHDARRPAQLQVGPFQ